MIAYDLQCSQGHCFEGWFEDEKAYLEQKKQQLVTCPLCDETGVTRVPSAFAIKSSRPGVPVDARQTELAQLGQQMVQFVEKNFDDVGNDFAKEALKMHYGVAEPRNIRGLSSKEEEKQLKEEGIEFFKFPLPKTREKDDS